MSKLTIFTVLVWMALAIIMIVGQFAGATVFFVVCNDVFAALNGLVCIALIPALIDEFKNRKRK